MAVRRPPSDNLKSLRALSQSPPHRPARKSLPCQTQARRDDPLHASPLWARCHMAFFERHADAGKLRVCETAILHCLWRARLATAHNPAASQSGASVGSNNREHKRSNPVSQPAPQRSLRHPRTQYARPCVVRSCDAGLRSRLRPCPISGEHPLPFCPIQHTTATRYQQVSCNALAARPIMHCSATTARPQVHVANLFEGPHRLRTTYTADAES
jgi:hypothetical protein